MDSITYERELYLLEGKLVSAEHTIEEQSFRIATLENCISVIKMELELEKYRALETQRKEHEAKLTEMKREMREEKKLSDFWFEQRVSILTAQLEEARANAKNGKSLVSEEYQESGSGNESEFSSDNDFSSSSQVNEDGLPSAGGRAVSVLLPVASPVVEESTMRSATGKVANATSAVKSSALSSSHNSNAEESMPCAEPTTAMSVGDSHEAGHSR